MYSVHRTNEKLVCYVSGLNNELSSCSSKCIPSYLGRGGTFLAIYEFSFIFTGYTVYQSEGARNANNETYVAKD